jgi:hypothetical protein
VLRLLFGGDRSVERYRNTDPAAKRLPRIRSCAQASAAIDDEQFRAAKYAYGSSAKRAEFDQLAIATGLAPNTTSR